MCGLWYNDSVSSSFVLFLCWNQRKKDAVNQYMMQHWPYISGTHGLRDEVLNVLNDADLSFNPGGQNMTLGGLCREMGDVQRSYIDSVRNHKQDWSYRNTTPGIETSTGALKVWFADLDKEMQALLESLSDPDFQVTIDRGGFSPTVFVQMEIYLQALLIFLGKASIYLKAMNKPMSTMFQQWIG